MNYKAQIIKFRHSNGEIREVTQFADTPEEAIAGVERRKRLEEHMAGPVYIAEVISARPYVPED